jgi:hypothetical protein
MNLFWKSLNSFSNFIYDTLSYRTQYLYVLRNKSDRFLLASLCTTHIMQHEKYVY